ncbi:MAG: glycosyltransferase family 9 protein [Planctomycetota bacterium]
MNLVFHHAALGDFALILPLLRGLDGPTTLVAPWSRGRLAAALIDGLQTLDIELFEFTRLHHEDGPSTLSPAVREAFEDARTVVSFVGNGQDAWTANVLRLAPQADVVHLPTRPPPEHGGHIAEFHRDGLTSHGVAVVDIPVERRRDPDGPVLIHPGSGGVAKCWPPERFAELIDRLNATGRPTRVVYGEAEAERWPAARLDDWRQRYDAVGCASLQALVEQMLTASAYVGNDAGPTHLAAQLGLPTLALFGPTDPETWSPRGPAVRVLSPPEPGPMGWLSVGALMQVLRDWP